MIDHRRSQDDYGVGAGAVGGAGVVGVRLIPIRRNARRRRDSWTVAFVTVTPPSVDDSIRIGEDEEDPVPETVLDAVGVTTLDVAAVDVATPAGTARGAALCVVMAGVATVVATPVDPTTVRPLTMPSLGSTPVVPTTGVAATLLALDVGAAVTPVGATFVAIAVLAPVTAVAAVFVTPVVPMTGVARTLLAGATEPAVLTPVVPAFTPVLVIDAGVPAMAPAPTIAPPSTTTPPPPSAPLMIAGVGAELIELLTVTWGLAVSGAVGELIELLTVNCGFAVNDGDTTCAVVCWLCETCPGCPGAAGPRLRPS